MLLLCRKRERRLQAQARRNRLTLDPREARDSDVDNDHLHIITPFPLNDPFNDPLAELGGSTEKESPQLYAAARFVKRLKSTASNRMRPSQTRAANDIEENPSRPPAGSTSNTAIMETLQRLQEQVAVITMSITRFDVGNGGGRQQSMRSSSSSATYVVD